MLAYQARGRRTLAPSSRRKEWDEPDTMAHVARGQRSPRVILARYPGTCSATGQAYERGARLVRTCAGGWALASAVSL